ncbi:MAG TPA: LacI family DNA-binding transcriptional regulator [Opitutaceae bacterium]|nr:LacI family DNA-binding transcriptional regulator [Opitutaceae bacterium]
MAKIQSVTIADLARKLGVCPATVSLALRNHASISLSTRRRIQAMAAKVGYRPHPAVSTLMARIRSNRTSKGQPIIAGITTWSAEIAKRDPTRLRFYEGAAARAGELGYTLEEFSATIPGLTISRLDGVLQARGIQGLLIFPVEAKVELQFTWERFSCATIGYTFNVASLHRASPAYFDNVVIALKELQLRGYRRVGLVNTPALRERLLRSWQGAFSAWHSESGRSASPAMLEIDPSNEGRFQTWMKRYRPDAILFGGTPVYAWARAMGLSVPRDLGLVSLCVAGMPREVRLTQVVEKPEVVGAAAIDLIVEQLQRNECGIPQDAKEVFITGEWIDGSSVAAPTTDPSGGSTPPKIQLKRKFPSGR